jgi:hypothetical protein
LAVFDLDCGFGVKAYEAELGEFARTFDGFEKVGGGVLFVEVVEKFEGAGLEGDFFEV